MFVRYVFSVSMHTIFLLVFIVHFFNTFIVFFSYFSEKLYGVVKFNLKMARF